jgi:ribonuclease T2
VYVQWPGSFCDTSHGCCFPGDVRPAADFGIHGLWPNYATCKGRLARAALLSILGLERRGRRWPQYCDDGDALHPWEIRDLVGSLDKNWGTLSCKNRRSFQFWSYEWKKHGTCSNLDQHEYFEAALALKARHNLTAILADAGVVPSDTETYSVSSISDAVAEGTGFTANLECNRNADGDAQLFQVYQCVDRTGRSLIDCPLSMNSKCTDQVKLPVF